MNVMDTPDDSKPSDSQDAKKVFKCHLCQLYSHYDYHGRKPLERHAAEPPTTRHESITLLEPCYIIDDPFVSQSSTSYLILGGDCSLCKEMVCAGSVCSFFYYKQRMCYKCCASPEYEGEFPDEIRAGIEKFIKLKK